MKWEVGKYYRTEKGRKARIYATDGRHARCVHGAILLTDGWAVTSWFENGVRVLNGSSDDDLIGEWKEPTEHYRPFRMDELHSVLGSIVKTKLGGVRRQITSVGCSSDHDVWIDLTGPAGEGQRMGVEELLDNWLLEDLNGVCIPCGVLTGSCVGTSARKSPEPVGDGVTDDTEAIQGKSKRECAGVWRPYTDDEVETLIGCLIRRKDCRGVIGKVGWVHNGSVLCADEWVSPLALFREWELLQPDDTWGPCGLLRKTTKSTPPAAQDYDWGIMGRPLAKPN